MARIPLLILIAFGIGGIALAAVTITSQPAVQSPPPQQSDTPPSSSDNPDSQTIPTASNQAVTPAYSPTSPSKTQNSSARNCKADTAVGWSGLPKQSPTNQWCELGGYQVCEAEWCRGYWADQLPAGAATVIYDCNDADQQGETVCKKISITQLPDHSKIIPSADDCKEVSARCSGPWTAENAKFCQQASGGPCGDYTAPGPG